MNEHLSQFDTDIKCIQKADEKQDKFVLFFFLIVLMHTTWLPEIHSLSALSAFIEGMGAGTHRVTKLHMRLHTFFSPSK